MTMSEAKALYETNGGHYFEWFPVFNQSLGSELFEPQRTFIVTLTFESGSERYTVLGFDEEYMHVFGYGKMEGYAFYEEAVKVAKRPGKPKW